MYEYQRLLERIKVPVYEWCAVAVIIVIIVIIIISNNVSKL